MKRCPQCGREYDNTMMFCLDDGAELLYGPRRADTPVRQSSDEPQTAILHSTAAPGEASDSCADSYYGADCGVSEWSGGGASGVFGWDAGEAELLRK